VAQTAAPARNKGHNIHPCGLFTGIENNHKGHNMPRITKKEKIKQALAGITLFACLYGMTVLVFCLGEEEPSCRQQNQGMFLKR